MFRAVARQRGLGPCGNALAGGVELERVFIDSTIVRAHQHAAGAKKTRPASDRAVAWRTDDQAALGRRRGRQSAAPGSHRGANCRIDCALEMVDDLRCGALIADKGYDANALVDAVEASGTQVVSHRVPIAWCLAPTSVSCTVIEI